MFFWAGTLLFCSAKPLPELISIPGLEVVFEKITFVPLHKTGVKTELKNNNMAKRHLPIGIDDMACHVPPIYLDLKDLAAARGIPYPKLARGLGLLKMALPDVQEDAATMAAEAIAELLEKNGLRPEQIGRLYMGTESALDNAKPTATYAADMVEKRLGGSFRHTDVVEMTFACVGAVDALQICLDWVAADRERVAVVVASDIAKYELGSMGEYTQGAGAVAMLVRWNPRLLVLPRTFGVAMKSEHDFFKPIRAKYTETPVFDGPFSNQCFADRMREALAHFRRQAVAQKFFPEGKYAALSDRWARMVFHLPYAFHGKRIFLDEFVRERKAAGTWELFLAKNKLENHDGDERSFAKAISKSIGYQRFTNKKLEKAQRASSLLGNVYAASIFFALMSTFEADFQEGSKLIGKKFGFIGYGSGSKSKVFEGTVQAGWREVAGRFSLSKKLDDRSPIDFKTYEALHQKKLAQPVAKKKGRFALISIGSGPTTEGARYYGEW